MRKLVVAIYLLGAVLFSSGSVLEIQNEKDISNLENQYNDLFVDNSPKSTVTKKDINKVISSANKLSSYNKESKNRMIKDLSEYKGYISLKKEILSNYIGEAIVIDLTNENINNYDKRANILNDKYKKELTPYIDDMRKQRSYIDSIETRINELYTDNNLKENVEKNTIESIKQDLEKLPQQDYANKKIELLNEAINIINERERIKAINNAWVNLNVGYISQNHNNVLNGCEAASLLMALQYKGYLVNTSLYDFATNMPKSTDPYQGFTYDIYRGEPYDVPHWIAPEPLANYGKSASGNQNIINGTGMSIDELDRELDNGNPVVIYLTAKFKTPRDWKEGAPTNLHVLLLVGYNKITGVHTIVDPWTHDDGRTRWSVSKAQLESIYNAVGKKSVIVR